MEWIDLALMYGVGISTGLGLALVIDWWRGH